MEGWLEKRYPLRAGKWCPRWCVLTPQSLGYFAKDAEGETQRGSIPILPGTHVVPFKLEGAPGDAEYHRAAKPFGFVLVGERFFYFSARDEKTMESWVQALTAAAQPPPAQGPKLSCRRTLRISVLNGLTAPKGGGFHGEDSRPVWQVYEQEGRLGSGAFGTVFRARELETDKVVALKKLPKKSPDHAYKEEAIQEFMRCAEVAHPHVLRVFTFFCAPDAVYLATEIAAGGELLDYLATHRSVSSEASIAGIAAQILSALACVHMKGLVHHDVKPSNILVASESFGGNPDIPLVVLADFGTTRLCEATGLGVHCAEGEMRGTPEYCGPEVFEGKSGDRTDVYAMGVTLFELLAGEKPFELHTDLFSATEDGGAADRFRQMRDPDKYVDWKRLHSISDEGRALVQRMMATAFEKRPSAAECGADPWFGLAPEIRQEHVLDEDEVAARAERLLKRARLGFYAKALLNMMATQMSGDLLQQERAIFRLIDRDKTGAISVEDLMAKFGKMGLCQERAAMVMRRYDIDRSGYLGFNEWMGATMFMDVEDSEGLTARVRGLFSRLDADSSGSILLEDLQREFGEQSEDSSEALEAFFNDLDKDKDGAVSLDDFMQFWRENS